jgi:hypothetical protein
MGINEELRKRDNLKYKKKCLRLLEWFWVIFGVRWYY